MLLFSFIFFILSERIFIMKKSNKKFNSNILNKIDSESKAIIDSHLKKVSVVSDDIKTLEKKLKGAAIPFTFIYIFKSQENRGQVYPDEYYGCDTYKTEYLFHCLVFGTDKHNNRRLLYNIYKIEDFNGIRYSEVGEVVGVIEAGSTSILSSIPLIETKSHFRLKVVDFLSSFYTMIIDHLATTNLAETSNEEPTIIVDSPIMFALEESLLISRGIY